jgi:hypothetical protein
MVLSFSKLLLLVVAGGQLCLSTAYVFPSTSTTARPSSTTSAATTFLPQGVLQLNDDRFTNNRLPKLPFQFTQRAAASSLNTQQSPVMSAVRSSDTPRRLPKLHLHVEDSELGDVVDMILELGEHLVPEPSVLATMGKILEVALQMTTN